MRRVIARKQQMSRIFQDGKDIPVTLLLVNKKELEQLREGQEVKISGITKGKGFQGVVKRHGARGGPASHGASKVLRTVGSTGSRFPQHTRKGTKMPGQTGRQRITLKGCKIVALDQETGIVAVKGAVPGGRNAEVTLLV